MQLYWKFQLILLGQSLKNIKRGADVSFREYFFEDKGDKCTLTFMHNTCSDEVEKCVLKTTPSITIFFYHF
jgi:hypothetical protein